MSIKNMVRKKIFDAGYDPTSGSNPEFKALTTNFTSVTYSSRSYRLRSFFNLVFVGVDIQMTSRSGGSGSLCSEIPSSIVNLFSYTNYAPHRFLNFAFTDAINHFSAKVFAFDPTTFRLRYFFYRNNLGSLAGQVSNLTTSGNFITTQHMYFVGDIV